MEPISQPETLSLSDGTSVKIAKVPTMGPSEWNDMKVYLEDFPEEARRWETWSKDAEAVRQWSQQTAAQEYYQARVTSGDEVITSRLTGLEKNPELQHIFDDVRAGGIAAVQQYSTNDSLMLKVTRALGGIPEEIKEIMTKIQSAPLTLQEACKMGRVTFVQEYLSSAPSADIDAKDAKGISGLGYAVGANRIAVVKLLLEKKANPKECDSNGGTALHYAAAYGRQELLELFLKSGLDANAKTAQGLTPLALATKNHQKAAMELLKSKGGM